MLGKVLSSGAPIARDLGAVQGVHDAAVTGQIEIVLLVVEGLTGSVYVWEEAVFTLR